MTIGKSCSFGIWALLSNVLLVVDFDFPGICIVNADNEEEWFVVGEGKAFVDFRLKTSLLLSL